MIGRLTGGGPLDGGEFEDAGGRRAVQRYVILRTDGTWVTLDAMYDLVAADGETAIYAWAGWERS
jgi:hypothetical protein